MACQKICKQGRDDIIVKVNLQSPIPTSFYITVENQCENNAGMRLCKFTFTIISSLPCLHTFWHAIPTHPFTFLMFFKSCWYIVMCSRSWILLEQLGQHKPIRGLVKPRNKATAGWLNRTRKMLHHPGTSLSE